MKRVSFLLMCIITSSLFSNTPTLSPPGDWNITSDFGPRNMSGVYDWHWGIDYGASGWSEVKAVEGGDILAIKWS